MPPAAISRTGVVLGLFEELIDDRQQFAANAIGQEAVVTDVAEITVRDVSNELSHEIANGERDGFGGIGVVVEIVKSDGLAVIGFDPGLAEGWAFEIFAEVFNGGLTVVGLLVEMDDPDFLIEDIKPGIKSRIGFEMF